MAWSLAGLAARVAVGRMAWSLGALALLAWPVAAQDALLPSPNGEVVVGVDDQSNVGLMHQSRPAPQGNWIMTGVLDSRTQRDGMMLAGDGWGVCMDMARLPTMANPGLVGSASQCHCTNSLSNHPSRFGCRDGAPWYQAGWPALGRATDGQTFAETLHRLEHLERSVDVVHRFHPYDGPPVVGSDNLVQLDVTVRNRGTRDLENVVYTRHHGFAARPTGMQAACQGSESYPTYVSMGSPRPASAMHGPVVATTDAGQHNSDPRLPLHHPGGSTQTASHYWCWPRSIPCEAPGPQGAPPGSAQPTGVVSMGPGRMAPGAPFFEEVGGPCTHGGYVLLDLGPLAQGETRRFRIYHGSLPSEAEARDLFRLRPEGMEPNFYFLGKAQTAEGRFGGTPQTYVWAFWGLHGPQASFTSGQAPFPEGPPWVDPTWRPSGWDPAQACVGQPVPFRDRSEPGPDWPLLARSTWEWGDGQRTVLDPRSATTAHAYAAAGTYAVRLTVADQNGWTDQAEGTVEVVECPFPPPPNGCPVLGPLPFHRGREGDLVLLQVQGSDRNPWSLPDPLTYGVGGDSLPPGASFDPETGRLAWQSALGDGGLHRITFLASDGWCTATVQALVLLVPEKPAPLPATDRDMDGVADDQDNCPSFPNRDQADLNLDGVGDRCDGASGGMGLAEAPVWGLAPSPDRDLDGVGDLADNCPTRPNRGQADLDGDLQGDACDDDMDGDGVPEAGAAGFLDSCPTVANPEQADADGDGWGDACDTLSMPGMAPPAPPRLASVSGTGAAGGIGAALAAVAVALLALRRRAVSVLIVAFSRLARHDLAGHPVRRQLLAGIGQEPGIHFLRLVRGVGRGRGTVEHHLAVLEAAGLVRRLQGPGRRYALGGVAPALLLSHEPPMAPLTLRVLEEVRRRPGSTMAEMVEAIGRPRNTIGHHVRRLLRTGLLRADRRGNQVLLYPNVH